MDKKFLKEKNLYEAHKQFMRLCEWTTLGQMVEEDDDEMPQDDPMGGAPMNGDAMGGAPDGEMPQDGGMDAESGAPIGDDMNAGSEMPQDDPMGGAPMGDDAMGDSQMPPMDDPMGGDAMGGEDETVIDVEDITNAQEKMNDKVNVVGQDLGKVDSKIEALLQTLSKMETMINNNNQEIANFKAEFEKRNPTQTEKLNLRSLDSYPFNVNPKDYWAQKGADPNSNYSGFSNNGEPTTQEYVITNNDVDDFSEREMEKSFDIADDLRQDINKIFGI
jgi:hypothetical protein